MVGRETRLMRAWPFSSLREASKASTVRRGVYRSDRWDKEWGEKRERKEERRKEREWLVITEQLLNSEKEQVARRERRSSRDIPRRNEQIYMYIYISLKKFRDCAVKNLF